MAFCFASLIELTKLHFRIIHIIKPGTEAMHPRIMSLGRAAEPGKVPVTVI
jgi:hypothetical protein